MMIDISYREKKTIIYNIQDLSNEFHCQKIISFLIPITEHKDSIPVLSSFKVD